MHVALPLQTEKHSKMATAAITMPRKKRMCGLDRALKDVEEGRVYRAESVEDMFKQILGEDYVQR